jgi:diguanylate cyclase (GGDEF)-like protein
MRVVGLFIDWISFSYHQQVFGGIETFCKKNGVNLMTLAIGRADSMRRWEQMRGQLLDFVNGQHFDGFIFLTATLGSQRESFYTLLDKVSTVPVISVADELPGVPSVLIDNTIGFLHLLKHLHETHGYRRFAYAGGPDNNRDSHIRREVFLGFMAERGLLVRPEHLVSGEFTTAWGAEAVAALIPGDRPDFEVLVCANDEICAGAISALTLKGLHVPQDLAVTGFDDTPNAMVANLSTVRQPLSHMGWTAASQLLDLIEGRGAAALSYLNSEKVIRQSCGCPSPAQRLEMAPRRVARRMTLAQLLNDKHNALLDEMVQEGLDAQVGLQVIAQFRDVLQTGHAANALLGMRGIVHRLARHGQLPNVLNFPLAVLRRWCLEVDDYPKFQALLESTFHQIHLQLSDELHVQSTHHDFRKSLVKNILIDLNVRMIYADDFSAQAIILLELLPQLGINAFEIVLYDDPENPMDGAHIVLTPDGEIKPDGITHDPKTLLTPQHTGEEEPWFYIGEALYDHKTSLGFFRLKYEGDHSVLSCFDQLCETVGRGIGTVRRIQNLESQVVRRTAQLQTALADLEQRNKALNAVALSDPLTGLYNRRGFLSLAEEYFQSQSGPHPVTLFFADLDGLKQINDTWGHEIGDAAIRTTARLLTETFRAEDLVARLGGDEFVILAPGCTPSVAQYLANRLADGFSQVESGRYGISMGWVAIDVAAQLPLSHWMKEADLALYREKQGKKAARRTM